MKAIGSILAAAAALALLVSSVMFTVDQRQSAIVFQFGEVRDVVTSPGLHFKLPLVQNVRYLDTRILTIDDPDPQRFITAENKPVLVDTFVKWRIIDARAYYIAVSDERGAANRISQTVNGLLREEFGKRTVHEVVSGERETIMTRVRERVEQDAKNIGVSIVDVRLKRVDLPQEVSADVYRRMESERKRVASELRSTGAAEAERIRAEAEKQREVILADAYRDAQRVRGEGDAKAAGIYAGAFSQNPEFYAFYRSMEAYRLTFRSRSDVMLLEPNSDFFRYLKDAAGRPGGKK
ncbi:MAG: protease modulator HflC [Betaproteobacteria bacterium]|nr:protease modulator HflC [Betaproteobacteria bacterium]